MKNSSFFKWNLKDFIKGLLVAIITTVIGGLYTSLNSGSIPLTWAEWWPILQPGILAGLAYLTKNLLTNSDDKFLKKENQA